MIGKPDVPSRRVAGSLRYERRSSALIDTGADSAPHTARPMFSDERALGGVHAVGVAAVKLQRPALAGEEAESLIARLAPAVQLILTS